MPLSDRKRPTLYACPHACSFSTHVALEMAGADFAIEFVDLFKGEQRSAAYLAINPKGKIPALAVGSKVITENVAILTWLAGQYPDAQLLPERSSAEYVAVLSDLVWFAATIHPLITRTVVPERFADAACAPSVRAAGEQGLAAEFARIDARLEGRQWWLEHPSAMDAYLLWLWARAQEGGFAVARFPNFAALVNQMVGLAPVRRALQREREIMPCFQNLDRVES